MLSPVPVHNEIEVFHNLTRSPERSRKASPTVENPEESSGMEKEPGDEAKIYDSFQVYKEVPLLNVPKESSVVIEDIPQSETLKGGTGKPSALQQSLSSLTSDVSSFH